MKLKLLLVGLSLASLAFAEGAHVLLMNDKRAIVKQAKFDDTSIVAGSIVFDADSKQLRCSGPVEVKCGSMVVRSNDSVIEIGQDAVVYRINPNGIEIKPNPESSGSAQPETGLWLNKPHLRQADGGQAGSKGAPR